MDDIFDGVSQADDFLVSVYADDLTVLHYVPVGNNCGLQIMVNRVMKWANETGFVVNTSKCSLLDISRSNNLSKLPYISITNELVKRVNELKLLGVEFSSNAKWDPQIKFIYKRCCRAMYIVSKLRKSGSSVEVLWVVYNACVFSIMSYCWPVFCDAPESLIRPLIPVSYTHLTLPTKA